MTDEQIDLLLFCLNGYAMDVDHYDFGLPVGFGDDKHMEAMRKIVKKALENKE